MYFIQHGDYGPIKIGTAYDPEHRLRELQCGNPEQLHIRYTMPGDRSTEGEFHRRFKDWRLQGEWFGGGAQSAAILAFAAGIKEDIDELSRTDGEVEFIGDAKWPITAQERLDLRYDIERLFLRHFKPGEIADELNFYWRFLTEDTVKQEIAEMRKSTVWDVQKRPPGRAIRPIRGAA